MDWRYSLARVLEGLRYTGWESQSAFLDELERRIDAEAKAGEYCGA